MSAPVDVLSGIGPATKSALSRFNIHTVADLAAAEPSDIHVPRISKFIELAQAFIQHDEEKAPAHKVKNEALVTLGYQKPTVKDSTPEKKSEEEEAKEEEEIFLADHSWWENKVLIPRERTDTMEEAVIYEMSVTPNNRVSFLCSWISEDKQKLCSMTYSPQFIAIFNLSLPPLSVSLHPKSLQKLKNRHVLENTLWETNTILKQIRQPEDHNIMNLLKF